jgi:AraC-like DNA-binding protein
VPLHDVWGADGGELRERLVEASSPRERFCILETALLCRLRRARPGHPAARVAVETFAAPGRELRVRDVAASVGLSRRRFIEVFEREVGLTPKLYVRLERFHRVKQHVAALGERTRCSERFRPKHRA